MGLDEGLQTSSSSRRKCYSLKAQFLSHLLGQHFEGIGHQQTVTEKKNGSTDRGIYIYISSQHCPGIRGGHVLERSLAQTWLAAGEDTHSADILLWKLHNMTTLSSLLMREREMPNVSISSVKTEEAGLFLEEVSQSPWSFHFQK